MLRSLAVKGRTLIKLGLSNIIVVFLYRLILRTSVLKKLQPIAPLSISFPVNPNQSQPLVQDLPEGSREKILTSAKAIIQGQVEYFSKHVYTVGNPPQWKINPWDNIPFSNSENHWSRLNEFSGSDIKICWELSRWEWSTLLVRAWRITGDKIYFDTWQNWSNDWNHKNPAHSGYNWKCGQECGIRLINGLLAAYLAGIQPTDAGFKHWIITHCERISLPIYYGVAQNNNHGTSEAAALFIGGLWLLQAGVSSGQRWCDQGRFWLETLVAKLLMPDGSFSQNSLTYHRVVLDTLCQVEWWRKHFNQPQFSNSFYTHAQTAIDWLWNMIDEESGDGSNLGANDGAKLFALHNCDYRDFRPTLQLSAFLFYNQRWLPPGPWDEPLTWLNIGSISSVQPPIQKTWVYPDGGYAVLRPPSGTTWALLRLPHYKFRPSHADALHFDLWVRGKNVLRDGGSFSYNTGDDQCSYFRGTKSHNTVQFDNQDQMPSLGRFLFGDWLDYSETPEWGETWVCSTYCNRIGNYHKRRVIFQDDAWQVEDEVYGWKHQATLRWRLIPGKWQMLANGVVGSDCSLQIQSSVPLESLLLIEGQESLYYLEKKPLPVLEARFSKGPAKTITTITIR
ncbi:alginate lyase family protein [Cylindrospermopsis raciborskii]|uniref:alginate lyase family protein n=1 Tax=Cylindrospermopsis raciborskii TaxID=77022 RepID=UPI003879E1D4